MSPAVISPQLLLKSKELLASALASSLGRAPGLIDLLSAHLDHEDRNACRLEIYVSIKAGGELTSWQKLEQWY